jgi:hypothetical protein
LLTAAPATHAQSAQPNGCVLTSALAPDQPKPIKIQQYQDLVMLAEVTDACPVSSYQRWESLVWGEYDPATLDYVRLDTNLVKTPQLTAEMMVLMPSAGAPGNWYGTGSFAYDMASAASNVQATLINAPPDANPPFGRWIGGLSKAETAAIPTSPIMTWTATLVAADACGPVDSPSRRVVLVTDTCTEATYPRVADPGVPSYSVGGTQFASTTTNVWLLAATATRDDGSGEVLVLIPVAGPDHNTTAGDGPPSDFPMSQVVNALANGKVVYAPTAPHEYYLSWISGGKP